MRPVCQRRFSTLHTPWLHNLNKEKLDDLTEWSFDRAGLPYLACNEKITCFTSEQ